MEDLVGLTTAPDPQRETARMAVNNCLAAAEAAFNALREDVPVGHLQEALLSRSPEEAGKTPLFSPIHVWTDGSGTGPDTAAGAGVVIRYHGPDAREEAFGVYLGNGTNNHAELSAVLHGLRRIRGADRLRPVVLHSDSTYAIGAASGRNKVNANGELIRSIRTEVIAFRDLRFKHVPGHAGVPENERADALAGRARVAAADVSE